MTLQATSFEAISTDRNHDSRIILQAHTPHGETEERIHIMIDSGATDNFIDLETATRLSLPLIKQKDIPLHTVTGDLGFTITHHVLLPLRIDSHLETVKIHVTKLGHQGIILGMPWLVKHGPSVDWRSKRVQFTSNFCSKNCLESSPQSKGVDEGQAMREQIRTAILEPHDIYGYTTQCYKREEPLEIEPLEYTTQCYKREEPLDIEPLDIEPLDIEPPENTTQCRKEKNTQPSVKQREESTPGPYGSKRSVRAFEARVHVQEQRGVEEMTDDDELLSTGNPAQLIAAVGSTISQRIAEEYLEDEVKDLPLEERIPEPYHEYLDMFEEEERKDLLHIGMGQITRSSCKKERQHRPT